MRGIREGWTRHPWEWLLLLAAVALLVTLAAAPRAHGSFHLMKIREVSGSAGGADLSYVELQMFSPGQTLLGAHSLDIYDEDAIGGPNASCALANVTNGDNQRTILIGDNNVAGRDITCANLSMIDANAFGGDGAVCFPDAFPPDCVSWGTTFSGASLIPDGATPFAGALPTTTALRRDISAGCSTLLEESDDTDSTPADFDDVARDPTPNSAVPIETACQPGGGGAPAKCGGLNATKQGTAGANVLVGTAGRDVIAGLGGPDTIRGLAGNDVLCGGAGRDKLIGGGGRDRLLGQAGRDICKGGPRRDVARTCEVKRAI